MMMSKDKGSPMIAETHISYVILLGDRAYKVKKPVRYPFIDQSTREARKALCDRELELNRRLSPDVYLRVLDVVGPDGQPVDHILEMRRMPLDRRLTDLIRSGADVTQCLRELARDLAAFHAKAARSTDISRCASQDAVGALWRVNLGEMNRFAGRMLDQEQLDYVAFLADRYVSGRSALFAARATEDHSCDGHGDLLADDVFCLDIGPRALDCIEFDDHLRWGDVIADVAFLAMDLERLGAADAAAAFVSWYREFSGDSSPTSLVEHYIAYRASVRSKIACLKHAQDGEESSLIRAMDLLALCERKLDHARIRLVLVGGLPGTGKSTVAQRLSDETGWALIRSDEVRKDINNVCHRDHPRTGFREGMYSVEMTDLVYAKMLSRGRSLLSGGTSVILDASWASIAHRQRAMDLAHSSSSDLVTIRCTLPAEMAAERIRSRRLTDTDPSDADEDIALAMAATMDPWPSAIEISTIGTRDEVARRVVAEALRA